MFGIQFWDLFNVIKSDEAELSRKVVAAVEKVHFRVLSVCLGVTTRRNKELEQKHNLPAVEVAFDTHRHFASAPTTTTTTTTKAPAPTRASARATTRISLTFLNSDR